MSGTSRASDDWRGRSRAISLRFQGIRGHAEQFVRLTPQTLVGSAPIPWRAAARLSDVRAYAAMWRLRAEECGTLPGSMMAFWDVRRSADGRLVAARRRPGRGPP